MTTSTNPAQSELTWLLAETINHFKGALARAEDTLSAMRRQRCTNYMIMTPAVVHLKKWVQSAKNTEECFRDWWSGVIDGGDAMRINDVQFYVKASYEAVGELRVIDELLDSEGLSSYRIF
jgi:hypothetical protein